MKIFITILLITTPIAVFTDELGPNTTTLTQKSNLEIGGTIYSSYFTDFKGDEFRISFNVNLFYYITDNVFIGSRPGFTYRHYSYYNTTVGREVGYHLLSIGPSISMGYTFHLYKALFLSIYPDLVFYYTKSNHWVAVDKYEYFDFQPYLNLAFKIDLKPLIVNITFNNSFIYYSDLPNVGWSDPYYSLSMGIGLSMYF